MEPLTERQESILMYITEQVKNRRVPSFRDIMSEFKFRGIKAVEDHLDALERKGYIKRERGKARTIEVIGMRRIDPIELPVLGRIAAGVPVLSEENIEGTVAVDRSWVKDENSFILKVKGESMIGAGIYDGDYAIIKQNYTAEDRDIVVAVVDDEATLKRFYRRGDNIILKPENPEMKPIVVKKGNSRISIIGKLIGVYRAIG